MRLVRNITLWEYWDGDQTKPWSTLTVRGSIEEKGWIIKETEGALSVVRGEKQTTR